MNIRSRLGALRGRSGEADKSDLDRAIERGDFAKAAAILRPLAENGNVHAQLRFADLYERGQGVAQNFVEATRWVRSAADLGSVPAQARLGEIYLVGRAAPASVSPAAAAHLSAERGQGSVLKALFPEGLVVNRDFAFGSGAARLSICRRVGCGAGLC